MVEKLRQESTRFPFQVGAVPHEVPACPSMSRVVSPASEVMAQRQAAAPAAPSKGVSRQQADSLPGRQSWLMGFCRAAVGGPCRVTLPRSSLLARVALLGCSLMGLVLLGTAGKCVLYVTLSCLLFS